MSELAKLTWPEAAARFHDRLVALQPLGSTEPHGPHLPLDTDVTIAAAQARVAARKLEALGVETLLLPALPHGLVNFADCFKGYVCFRPGTLWAVIEDIVHSLEEQGVQRVVLCNAHLEPAHVRILRGVTLDHAERAPGKAQLLFPDYTRRRYADRLGEEFHSGDCHAGRYESSIVLAEDPSSVRVAELERLPEVRIELVRKMKEGARSFAEAGATQGYCGDPARASASEGAELVERLAEIVVESVRETWPDLFA